MCCDEAKVNKVAPVSPCIIAMEGRYIKRCCWTAQQLPCDHVHYCSAVWLPHHVHHLHELLV